MTILVALFSLAAIVWMIPVIRSGRITPLATIVLLAGTVLGPAFFAIDGPMQISLDRVLWAGMFAIIAVRWRMGELSISKLNRVDCVVIGLAIWLLISALRGGPVPTGSSPTARWLFYVAMPIGMYAVSRLVEIRDSDIRWLTRAMIALGVYLAVMALCEITGVHSMVFPRYIVTSDSYEFLGRGRGPLLNPAGNGIVMTISLIAAIVGFQNSTRQGKLVYGLVALVIAVGVFATLTRSAWLGAAAAVAMVAMVYAPRWFRVLGMSAVILFGGAVAMGLKDQLVRLKRDKHLTAADAEKSIQLRPLLAVVGFEMFKDRPIVGHGFGHYFEHSGPYHDIRGYDLPLQNAKPYAQHNVLLSILIDAGLIGLMMVVTLFAMLAGIGWQLARDRSSPVEGRWIGMLLLGTLAAYVGNGMFQDVLIIPMVQMYLFFVAGLAVTVFARGLQTGDVPARAIRPETTPVAATA